MLVSEAARAALVILVVAATTIGGTWAYTAARGPLVDEPPPLVEEDGIFLVTYRMEEWTFETSPKSFSPSGAVDFKGIDIPLRNVTTVVVTLRIAMGGPVLNDQYDVAVTDPAGETLSGSHTGPQPSPAGYIHSREVIQWTRTVQPPSKSYHTRDPAEAERWSAENHTDASANGTWGATVRLNQPMVARSGNASLLFHFSYYEALVLPKTRATAPAPSLAPDNGSASGEADADAPAATNGTSANGTAPSGPFAGVPRTFITARPVDAPVDRGRTAHRPL